MPITRRAMTQGLAATASLAALPARAARGVYTGPAVIIVRFGGGVRRREVIDPAASYAPYFLNTLVPRGVLIPNLSIAQLDGVETSHAEGTLNILAGRYRAYREAGGVIGDRLEPLAPTLFEYFRKAYDVPAHQALLINGEDRPQEEFFSYGVHQFWGVNYRSEVLSLFRFKVSMLRRQLESGAGTDQELRQAQRAFARLQQQDYRGLGPVQTPRIEAFWQDWEDRYGRSGLKNPRGDSLLTELAVQALDKLSPKLLMINYQDPDYVHWGVWPGRTGLTGCLPGM